MEKRESFGLICLVVVFVCCAVRGGEGLRMSDGSKCVWKLYLARQVLPIWGSGADLGCNGWGGCESLMSLISGSL